jgi:uncharacterized membrane protein YeaQ/YmgE (transglycosylase-associated protein family)
MDFIFLAQNVTDEPVVISTTVGQLVTWIIVGLIAGLLASFVYRERISLLSMIIIGLLGAILGGFLFDVLDIVVTGTLADGVVIRWIDILVAFIGATIILLFTGTVYRRRL